MVKVRVPDVPPLVVTVTVRLPTVAVLAMVKVAVICVELTTATLLTVTPVPETLTVAPETKLVPVKVTETAVPLAPLVGERDASVGAVEVTVNVTAPLVPYSVVTLILRDPAVAVEAIVRLAVI
jgi:hypothetical protein